MQAINRLLRKIVIVTHIFSDVPQLNITNFFQQTLKDLSVALLFIFLLCSVFKVQAPASFEARS